MNKVIPGNGKILVVFLIITLLASIVFLSGFTYPDNSINTGITVYNSENSEEQGEENEFEEEENQDGVEKWICGVCGYVYDPAVGDPENGVVEGTIFEDLPDDWICPVCGSSKLEFEIEDEGQLEESEGWLAHLEHVLEMRSKHIVVLQRVIEKMISKDPTHPSILSLQHALQSSSKSIQRAQEAIDCYKEYLDNTDDDASLEGQSFGTMENTETQKTQDDKSRGNNGNGKGKNGENNGKGKNK